MKQSHLHQQILKKVELQKKILSLQRQFDKHFNKGRADWDKKYIFQDPKQFEVSNTVVKGIPVGKFNSIEEQLRLLETELKWMKQIIKVEKYMNRYE